MLKKSSILICLFLMISLVNAGLLDKIDNSKLNLNEEANNLYKKNEITIPLSNSNELKKVYDIKIDNITLSKIDVKLDKCVKREVKKVYTCKKYEKKKPKIMENCLRKKVVSREVKGCIEYKKKSDSEIDLEIKSKAKYHLEKDAEFKLNNEMQ